MIATAFGYTEDDPSLKKLLDSFAGHRLCPSPETRRPGCLAASCLAFCGKSQRCRLSRAMARQQQQRQQLRPACQRRSPRSSIWTIICTAVEINDLLDVMTFQAVEQVIASSLRERVQQTADTINAEEVRAIADPSGKPDIGRH